jgi:hypothetical protein
MSKEELNAPTSMVAPRSQAQQEPLRPVEQHAAECNMPAPNLAGMCRANNWAPGKQVTAGEFDEAMEAYAVRPMGSGRG